MSLLDVKVDERGCKACHDEDVDPFADGRPGEGYRKQAHQHIQDSPDDLSHNDDLHLLPFGCLVAVPGTGGEGQDGRADDPVGQGVRGGHSGPAQDHGRVEQIEQAEHEPDPEMDQEE